MTNAGTAPSRDEPVGAFVAGLTRCWKEERGGALSSADRQYLASLLREHGAVSGDCVETAILALQSSPSPLAETEISGNESLARSHLLGVLAAAGDLGVAESGEPYLSATGLRQSDAGALESIVGAPPVREGTSLSWRGVVALDALGHLLSGPPGPRLPSFEAALLDWTSRLTHLVPAPPRRASIRVQLVHPEAILPSKERISDSGYDLTLLYEKKSHGTTTLYGTGVIIEPPYGWYFDVVPRSSIIKRGYMLANSVGIIDRSYRGEIFVPLVKIDPDAEDLELPARVAQIIPRPIVHFPVEQCEELTETHRGAGGFGSTGK